LPGDANDGVKLLFYKLAVLCHEFRIVKVLPNQEIQVHHGFKRIVDLMHDGGGKLACHGQILALAQALENRVQSFLIPGWSLGDNGLAHNSSPVSLIGEDAMIFGISNWREAPPRANNLLFCRRIDVPPPAMSDS
jgi:hypothetical protein